MSEFRLLDRGLEETVLLIPGWATDYRIFGQLYLNSNILLPIDYSPFDFEKNFSNAMKEYKLDKISILGWSMGGFVALDLISKFRDKIKDVILVSMRERYEKGELDKIKKFLKKNRQAFLYKFYKSFFSNYEKEEMSWFKRTLLKSYLNEMDLRSLLDGLEYLAVSRIEPKVLDEVNVKFVHGEDDRVAPIEEALRLRDDLPQAEFVLMRRTGHMPFLNTRFKKVNTFENILR